MAARVEGVSIALPQTVMIHGRPINTSILREPSLHPIHFGETGPENNSTAVHSEHVLISLSGTVDYWRERLGRHDEAWGPGYWGDNLTISGLPDELELRIGTVLQVGPAVRMEIVGPRVPCYKLMWRIGMPDSFIRDMMLDGHVGIYARMLETGDVSAGDRVEVVSIPDHDMTTARLAGQLAPNVEGDADTLREALILPAIGRQATFGIERKLSHIEDEQRFGRNRWTGWRDFGIARREEVAPGVVSVWFEAADGKGIAPFRGGQHVAVRLPSGVIRNWTLSDYEAEPTHYRISVRRLTDGRGSNELHGLGVGDTVSLKAPAGKFFLNLGGLGRNVLISAGIGITPMLSMLKSRADRASGPATVWVHQTQNGESYAHADEVRPLLASVDDTTSFVAYSRPGSSDREGEHFHHAGRFGPEQIARLTEPYTLHFVGRSSTLAGTESNFFLCGPAEFEEMVRVTLVKHGVPAERIVSEQFAAIASPGGVAGPEEAKVAFAQSGIDVRWSADDPVSLLELAERAGLSPDFECRSGECHRCATKLVSGAISYPVKPLVAPVDGEVLLCCARPATAELALAL